MSIINCFKSVINRFIILYGLKSKKSSWTSPSPELFHSFRNILEITINENADSWMKKSFNFSNFSITVVNEWMHLLFHQNKSAFPRNGSGAIYQNVSRRIEFVFQCRLVDRLGRLNVPRDSPRILWDPRKPWDRIKSIKNRASMKLDDWENARMTNRICTPQRFLMETETWNKCIFP